VHALHLQQVPLSEAVILHAIAGDFGVEASHKRDNSSDPVLNISSDIRKQE
jgi:hypothetical protein